MTNYDFTAKVALVTGGGSGIGEACALTFARDSEAQGAQASFIRTDVSDPAQNEAMVRHALERGGAIVNVTSILGSVGFANAPAYVAAKHGILGLTKTVAQYVTGLHPVGRMGKAQEVANLVAFLASDDALFITGSYHLVDGGYTAQ